MNREPEAIGVKHGSHSIHIDDRRRANVSGVTDVDSFDESTVAFTTDEGYATLSGQHLHISRLNLEEGQMVVEGEIYALEYADREARTEKGGGFFSRLWK